MAATRYGSHRQTAVSSRLRGTAALSGSSIKSAAYRTMAAGSNYYLLFDTFGLSPEEAVAEIQTTLPHHGIRDAAD